jgi:DNA-binding response OmpR family regulator
MNVRPRILVANGNDDILAALDEALSHAGYEVKTLHVRALRLGEIDFPVLFREFRPAAAIVDIGPPYDVNWAFAQQLVKHVDSSRVPFLWTTTNARALTELTGARVEELLLKPYDLDHLLEKVQRVISEGGSAKLPPLAED